MMKEVQNEWSDTNVLELRMFNSAAC